MSEVTLYRLHKRRRGGDGARPSKPRGHAARRAQGCGHVGGAPHTLHPVPSTVHLAPCTLHPTPYTLHPAPYTLHLRTSTLNPP